MESGSFTAPSKWKTVDYVDKVLNEKCFNGKNFYEIESDVTVENIF